MIGPAESLKSDGGGSGGGGIRPGDDLQGDKNDEQTALSGEVGKATGDLQTANSDKVPLKDFSPREDFNGGGGEVDRQADGGGGAMVGGMDSCTARGDPGPDSKDPDGHPHLLTTLGSMDNDDNKINLDHHQLRSQPKESGSPPLHLIGATHPGGGGGGMGPDHKDHKGFADSFGPNAVPPLMAIEGMQASQEAPRAA